MESRVRMLFYATLTGAWLMAIVLPLDRQFEWLVRTLCIMMLSMLIYSFDKTEMAGTTCHWSVCWKYACHSLDRSLCRLKDDSTQIAK